MCLACDPGLANICSGMFGDVDFKTVTPEEATASGTASNVEAVVFYNGHIRTMVAENDPMPEALAIQDGKILSVGSLASVKQVAGNGATLRDLQGRCLLPGFIEPHLHLTLTALATNFFYNFTVDTGGVTSKDKALEQITAHYKNPRTGTWFIAYGYDPSRVENHDELTIEDLDMNGLTAKTPIYIINQSGHLAYANSRVFELAGVSAATADDTYYQVVPTEGGGKQFTGKIFEGGMRHVGLSIHKPPKVAVEMFGWCTAQLNTWAKTGCTTVFDAGMGMIAKEGDILLAQWATSHAAPVRYYAALASTFLEAPPPPENENIIQKVQNELEKEREKELEKYLKPITVGNINIQAVKFWADGSTQGLTAALLENYNPARNVQQITTTPADAYNIWGTLQYLTSEELAAAMEPWAKRGFQLMVHANGDAAVQLTLDAYSALSQNGSTSVEHAGMNRIEHFTVPNKKQISQAKSLGLGVSHTIGHVHFWGKAFMDWALQKEQAMNVDPCKWEEEAELVWSMNSDACVTEVNPILYIQTAVTRKTTEGICYNPDQQVSTFAALRAVGYNAAQQIGIENQVGTLEAEKWADLVVLSEDPFDSLDNLSVDEVWQGGRLTVQNRPQ